ncbi:protein GLUTELIN PRECURSOR ACCUMULATION 3 isoform X1 [Polypterus senegalus]|uniref:protein GLUTELIN PRECURSOR ACCUMULATION 3 isoform X1 n=1 Tax=Polypterus senegalus TaxID=55291 RepID=UPI00196628D6|nr:protein GLUTELIN PRECURSOR ACCUMULATION 3 isoform X1 [Polypterus senegalus]
MGKVNFYVLWSLREVPRQLISKCNRLYYQSQLPLPLPRQLIVFGLGDWKSYTSDASISVEVSVSPDVKPQKIGQLTSDSRSIVWEGDWRLDLLTAAIEQAELGVFGKIMLTVNGQVKTSFTSSTPVPSRKRLNMDWQLSSRQIDATMMSLTSGVSHLPVTLEYDMSVKPDVASEDQRVAQDDPPFKKKCMPPNTIEEEQLFCSQKNPLHIAHDWVKEIPLDAEVNNTKLQVCPNPRWGQAMCLSDPETAVLIGGEGRNKKHCTDSLWKLEIENDFWFPMDSSACLSMPLSSRGHTATYDSDSKLIYVFGGIRDGKRYNNMYVLNTLTWKWTPISAKGKVPTLAFHSATIYRKELYVFGGVYPKNIPEGEACNNTLFIFNPEYELWYQPIVEGDRPLPRFGHSATLLTNKLIIFGGKKNQAYLNDLHIMDLGFMEYTSVQYANLPPVPRGFHAAVPISDQKLLISGGRSAIGPLQDVHLFDLASRSWTAIRSPALCSVPRAGHSLINLNTTHLTDTEKQKQMQKGFCTLLLFGGSDCAGNFYSDTVKAIVEI